MLTRLKKVIIWIIWVLISILFGPIGVFCLFYGGSIIFQQVVGWLKEGVWEAVPLAAILPQSIVRWVMGLEWIGVKAILVFVINILPGSLFAIVMGVASFYLLIWLTTNVVYCLEDRWNVEVVFETPGRKDNNINEA